jgi:hypothetical protein
MAEQIDVVLERGEKRVFAVAVDWPGWSRSGRGEDDALEALVAYGERYAAVAKRASLAFTPPSSVAKLHVAARLQGSGGTDFGVPGVAPPADEEPLTGKDLARDQALLEASWATFDDAARRAGGVELRKGPRGGGRDLEKIVKHVLDAEHAYIGELGARYRPPHGDVQRQMRDVRQAELKLLASIAAGDKPVPGPRRTRPYWSPRYFVRRSAWHALDHAWEIEDRAVR